MDPIAVRILFITSIVAIKSTKATSRIKYIAYTVHIVVLLFIIIARLTHAEASNLSYFLPYGVEGVFSATAALFFAYIGFDAVATMAEETKNPAKDIPIGLVGFMVVIITAYCVMALTLCLMQNYGDIDPDAAFSVVFEKVGMKWAKYIIAFGALRV